MTPLMVSGSAHEAESVRENPFTLETAKFLGEAGTRHKKQSLKPHYS